MFTRHSRNPLRLRCWWLIVFMLFSASAMTAQLRVGHYVSGLRLDWHPNGNMIAIANDDLVQIVDANSSQIIHSLPQFSDFVGDVEWNPDGTKLAIATGPFIQIWQVPSSLEDIQLLLSLEAPTDINIYGVISLDWHPNGDRLLSINGINAHIWDVYTGQMLRTFVPNPDSLTSVSWSSDGNLIAIGNLTGYVLVENLNTGQLEGFQTPDQNAIYALDWNLDDSLLAAGTGTGITHLLSLDTFLIQTGNLNSSPNNISSLAFNPIITNFVAVGSIEGNLVIWNSDTQKPLYEVETNHPISSLDWSPDGTKLAYNVDRTLEVVDTPPQPIAPIADAGSNQIIQSLNGVNSTISLDGSASTGMGSSIVEQYWFEADTLLSSDMSFEIELGIGEHTIELFVVSDNGLTDSDDVVITVVAPSSMSGTLTTAQTVSPFDLSDGETGERDISSRLIFASDRGDVDAQVYSMNPDGTDVQIFGEDRTYITPACSSNGEYLVVVSDAIYVMKSNGSDLKRIEVERLEPYSGLSVSNDGSKIAFLSLRDMNSEIYLVNADGTDETRFTNTVAGEASPAISPDGTKILFVSFVDNIGSLYVADIAGTNQTLLMQGVSDASWSPDGMQIVFTSSQNGMLDIARINADGTNLVQLISHPSADYQPRWSPDGHHIAFVSKRDGNMEIYTMDTDGQNIQRVTHDPEFDDLPCWLNIPAE